MKKEREFALQVVLKFVLEFYVVVVAGVVVIVDVDDEEGEGGGEDAQRRKSNNPNLMGFLSCMDLYHIHSVRMQCFARCMFSTFILPFHCIHIAVTKAHAACRRPCRFYA